MTKHLTTSIIALATALATTTTAVAADVGTNDTDTATILTSAFNSATYVADRTHKIGEDSGTTLPDNAIVLHGDIQNADNQVLSIYYSREGLTFNEAEAPRFILLDRKGKIAFGIGGTIYATASTDFNGAIDSRDFVTADIAVPNTSTLRRRFGADVSNSGLYIRMAGRSPRFGLYTIYIRTNFTGNGESGYGFRLKQAYIRLRGFTVGLDNSTFIDAASMAPVIDPQGPSGEVCAKNVLFRYTTPVHHGFRAAISIEVPRISITEDDHAVQATTRVPDIPLYIQYADPSGNRLRLSAIYRNLSYRDLVAQTNRRHSAWGVHLSGEASLGIFKPFGHIIYGQGIASYINDFSGNGLDLAPKAGEPGRLTTPDVYAFTIGSYIYFTKQIYMSAGYSRAQIMRNDTALPQEHYRYGQYAYGNFYYDLDDNFRIGAEYIHGTSTRFGGDTGTANRLSALLRYAF